MRYFLICYIINLRRNSLCQVKETITQNSYSLYSFCPIKAIFEKYIAEGKTGVNAGEGLYKYN